MDSIPKIIALVLCMAMAETASAQGDLFKTYPHVKKRVDQADKVFNDPAQTKETKLDIVTKACNYAVEKKDLPEHMRCLLIREQLTGKKFRVANALGPAEHFYRLGNYELAFRFYKDAYTKNDEGLKRGLTYNKGTQAHRFQAVRSALETGKQNFVLAHRKFETSPLAMARSLYKKGYYKEANEYFKLYVPRTYAGNCFGISSQSTAKIVAETAIKAGDYEFAMPCLQNAVSVYENNQPGNFEVMRIAEFYENLILSGVKVRKSDQLSMWLDALYKATLAKQGTEWSIGPISEERYLKRIASYLRTGGYTQLAEKVDRWPRHGNAKIVEDRFLQVSKDCDANNSEACQEKLDIITDENFLLWGAKDLSQLRDDTALKLCDLGKMEGCFNIGEAYRRGNEFYPTNYDKSYKLSREFHQKGCDNDHAHSCYGLYIAIKSNSPKIDKKLAERSKRKACKLDLEKACK